MIALAVMVLAAGAMTAVYNYSQKEEKSSRKMLQIRMQEKTKAIRRKMELRMILWQRFQRQRKKHRRNWQKQTVS